MRQGIFITFEGPEGSGKSTHMRRLAAYLKKRGHAVTVTREPGGAPSARALRSLLLQTRRSWTPLAELFLYEADRAQHVDTVVRPALQRGEIVLCDRYTDSTVAYQGDGRGLSKKMITTLNQIASGALSPHLTLLLDVEVQRGLRQAHRKGKLDRLEKAGLEFHQRVRRGFLQLAKSDARRFRIISQQPRIEETQARVRSVVDAFLAQ